MINTNRKFPGMQFKTFLLLFYLIETINIIYNNMSLLHVLIIPQPLQTNNNKLTVETTSSSSTSGNVNFSAFFSVNDFVIIVILTMQFICTTFSTNAKKYYTVDRCTLSPDCAKSLKCNNGIIKRMRCDRPRNRGNFEKISENLNNSGHDTTVLLFCYL